MKKFIVALFLMTVPLALAACGGPPPAETPDSLSPTTGDDDK